jgi:pimeloyl-ACP methyl ester carboxylesterase
MVLVMKTFIKNRDGRKVCVVVEGSETPGKLAFVMHGLGGNKGQEHIRALIEAFLEAGYVVVSFDTTNTFGESDGKYENATITNYYADLEDVIAWASRQPWYIEPFVLCGHSLGGISTALFAENHPERVTALAPLATVVSGELSLEAHKMFPELEDLDEWKRDGVRVTKSFDGKTEERLKWSHIEDRLKYNLLLKVDRLSMPVLLIVGEKDNRTPLAHQQILFDRLPGRKELHVVKGAPHTFYKPEERRQLKQLVKSWAQKL